MPVFHVEMRWRCSACRTENLGRHKTCQHCTKPKDDEPFYDPPSDAAVTDEKLVALATAGADWECRYCGVHQPRARTRCENCGAPEKETDERAPVPAPIPARATAATAEMPAIAMPAAAMPAAAMPATAIPAAAMPVATMTAATVSLDEPQLKPRRRWAILIPLGVVFVVIGALFWFLRPRELDAHVAARSWEHTVVVERYRIVDGQGFAENQPGGAFDVVSMGQRHHHDDRVQDGTTRESYSERVACGEDCSTTSVHCSTNDNGFKTCSGGDRVCKTRYCSETRYREVPRYKNVPVSRPWYRWRAWQWQVVRSVVDQGTDQTPTWPSDERLALNTNCGPGEQERARRESKYSVSFEDDEHERYPYTPRDIDEFARLTSGTHRKLRVGPTQKPQLLPQ